MTTIQIFDSKEQYVAFRKAWASVVNSPAAKSKLIPPTQYTAEGKPIKAAGRSRIKGCLGASHMMTYNILRGRNPYRGFSDSDTGRDCFHRIQRAVEYAHKHIEAKKLDTQVTYAVSDLLSPFKSTVSVAQLAKLHPLVGAL